MPFPDEADDWIPVEDSVDDWVPVSPSTAAPSFQPETVAGALERFGTGLQEQGGPLALPLALQMRASSRGLGALQRVGGFAQEQVLKGMGALAGEEDLGKVQREAGTQAIRAFPGARLPYDIYRAIDKPPEVEAIQAGLEKGIGGIVTDPTDLILAGFTGGGSVIAKRAFQVLMGSGLTDQAYALAQIYQREGVSPRFLELAAEAGVNVAALGGAEVAGRAGRRPTMEPPPVTPEGFTPEEKPFALPEEGPAPEFMTPEERLSRQVEEFKAERARLEEPTPEEIRLAPEVDDWVDVPVEAAQPAPQAEPGLPLPEAPLEDLRWEGEPLPKSVTRLVRGRTMRESQLAGEKLTLPPDVEPLLKQFAPEEPLGVAGPETEVPFTERRPELRTTGAFLENFSNAVMDRLQGVVAEIEGNLPEMSRRQPELEQYEHAFRGTGTVEPGVSRPRWFTGEAGGFKVDPTTHAWEIMGQVRRGQLSPEAAPAAWLRELADTAIHETLHTFAGTEDVGPMGQDYMARLSKTVANTPEMNQLVESWVDSQLRGNPEGVRKLFDQARMGGLEEAPAGRALSKEFGEPDFIPEERPFSLEAPPPPGQPPGGGPPPSGEPGQLPLFPEGAPRESPFKADIADIMNVPRSAIAGFDLSGLRQAAPLVARYPKIMGRVVKAAFKEAMANPMAASELESAFWKDPKTLEIQRVARNLNSDFEFTKAGVRPEEAHYGTRLIAEGFRKIGLGKVDPFTRTERGFTLMLNKARADVLSYKFKQLERMGFTPDSDPAAYKATLDLVNNLSGRGALPRGKGELAVGYRNAQKLLNAIAFSPRMIHSRLNLGKLLMDAANPVKWAKMTPAERMVRMQGVLDLGAFISLATAVTYASAAALGGEVEEDPRSSDFMKVRKGDARLDFTGGVQPYLRSAAQLITGERKTKYGQVQKESRADVLKQFGRSRLAPVPSTLVDILVGREVTGEKTRVGVPFTGKGELGELTTPMAFQDIIELWKEDPALAMAMAPLAILGAVSPAVHEAPFKGKLGEEYYQRNVPPPRAVESVKGPQGAGYELSLEESEEMEEEGKKFMQPTLEELLDSPSYKNLTPAGKRIVLEAVTKELRSAQSARVRAEMLRRHPKELLAPPPLVE